MYTPDPSIIPFPRQPAPAPDFRSEFYRQLPDMRPTMPRRSPVPATARVCRFDPQAKRVWHIRGGCPHFPDGEG